MFNPFKMKEKWMKFFRTGITKVTVDPDRALKNDLNESLKMFISDKKLSFTDKQQIRALLILHKAFDGKLLKEKDRLLNGLLANII